MNRFATLLLAAVISTVLISYSGQRAFAHTFQGGDSAEFLTMVQIIKSETSLAASNLDDKDTAKDHVEHAAEALTNSTLKELAERNERLAKDLPASLESLDAAIDSGADASQVNQNVKSLSDLLDEAVTVRIEKVQLDNSTVKAVVVSNLVNEALEHYGEAIGFEGNMTDMSNMTMSDSHSTGNNSTGMSSMGSDSNVTVVSVANYQSARAFAQKAQELYQEIKARAINGTETATQNLDSAFPDFIKAIDSKASAQDVMNIAHARIHPNLMVAYNLQVVPEFPLPLLMLLPVLGAIIAIGRFRLLPGGSR
ncbi:MAG: hypothetical protein ABI347_05320 [Nitrososphaera sp.]|jgi:tetratricopeptide (TPR) repeat protein